MIIDRTHRGWAVFTVLVTVLAAALYLMTFHPEVLPVKYSQLQGGPVLPLTARAGGTPLGLIYGSIALAIFLMAGLLGWRRKHPSWRVGRLQVWLKAHVWLTVLTIPLVLFHSGFHGGGFLTQLLLWLYGFVMISGFFGLALQHFLPHFMRQVLPDEVVFEQIPYLCEKLIEEAQKCRTELETQLTSKAQEEAQKARKEMEAALSSKASGELQLQKKQLEEQMVGRTAEEIQEAVSSLDAASAIKLTADTKNALSALEGQIASTAASLKISSDVVFQLIDEEVLPFLNPKILSKSRLAKEETSDRLFKFIAQEVPPALRGPIDRIQQLCDEKRRMNIQTRMQYWLHGWILVHAPFSFLLIIVTIWHAVVASYMY